MGGWKDLFFSPILPHTHTLEKDIYFPGMALHLLMGSVAEKVVRQAPCPVLVVKAFGKSLLPM